MFSHDATRPQGCRRIGLSSGTTVVHLIVGHEPKREVGEAHVFLHAKGTQNFLTKTRHGYWVATKCSRHQQTQFHKTSGF